jgi:hypothetical protein
MAKISLRRSWVPLCVALTLSGSAFGVASESKQEHVHAMGHEVMPFSMSKTVHVFKMTETGGVERVLVRDPADADQIPLIRQHLRHEAEKFQNGDYSDPARLHGKDMPGLKDLQAGAAKMTISYQSLPLGAEITFSAPDVHLLTALHRWFGAQLSEHGADARAE